MVIQSTNHNYSSNDIKVESHQSSKYYYYIVYFRPNVYIVALMCLLMYLYTKNYLYLI